MANYRVLKRFFSRKNEVYLVSLGDELYVLKRFSDPSRARIEWKYLEALSDRFRVPRPIRKEGREILMEYIEGDVLSEVLDLDNLKGLAEWLAELHSLNIKKGDCILRNFIYTKKGIYGIDWEEASFNGRFKDDLIDVCGSIIWIYQRDIKRGLLLCEKFLEFYPSRSGLEGLISDLVRFFHKRLEYRPELKEKIMKIINSLKSTAP